jgi:hypothetical protein
LDTDHFKTTSVKMLAALARHAREAERFLPFLGRISSTARAPYAQTAALKPPLLKEFQLYRFDPEKDDKPYYKTYRVDINKYVSRSAAPE